MQKTEYISKIDQSKDFLLLPRERNIRNTIKYLL